MSETPKIVSTPAELKRFVVPVQNMDDALSLVVDTLGCRLMFRDAGRWALVEGESMSFALAGETEAEGITSPALMVKVPDIDDAISSLVRIGATVIRGPREGPHEIRAFVQPPDGPLLVLYAPLAKPGDAAALSGTGTSQEMGTEPRIDPTLFRHVIGHFASGVTVITVGSDGVYHGMTANAVSSLSLEPPMLLVCLNLASATQRAIARERSFVVNILGESQKGLAERFAQHRPDKFDGVDIRVGELGHPTLVDVLGRLECRVVNDIVGGTHRVFLAEVVHAATRPGTPLAYFRGRFGRVEVAQDAETHRQRLLDADTANAAFTAKLVIDLGVADLTSGHASPGKLAALRRLAERTVSLAAGGQVDDVERYLAASVAFQEGVIGLSGNPLLVEAYRRLAIAEIVTPALRHPHRAREQLARGRLRLVEAYENNDLDAVRTVMASQYELARKSQRAAIAAAGGRL